MSEREAIDATRAVVGEQGPLALVVDDLTEADLTTLGWFSSPSHLRAVALALKRADAGEVDYLAVRAPTGEPVAKGGVDYVEHLRPHDGPDGLVDFPEAGTLWQLSTHGDLWGLGLMTALIAEAERRVTKRGLDLAVLGVEVNNARARRLYEHLGYSVFAREFSGWDQEAPDGTITRYETEISLMRKSLAAD